MLALPSAVCHLTTPTPVVRHLATLPPVVCHLTTQNRCAAKMLHDGREHHDHAFAPQQSHAIMGCFSLFGLQHTSPRVLRSKSDVNDAKMVPRRSRCVPCWAASADNSTASATSLHLLPKQMRFG
eukprot:scaffold320809_cov18-Tisochrysis_lutea.AAC.1